MPQKASKPVKAKLYTVSDPLDRPVDELIKGQRSVEVQFNPTSLKVSLSNSLKENESSGNTRAAQYVDKSSSSLTVELTFDTSDFPPKEADVRLKTRKIADTFMAPGKEKKGTKPPPPKRCLFQWGSFAFVGIMESFDETLDFFSPEGIPLRATVALKLSESRFQFRSKEAKTAARNTPKLSSPAPDAPVSQVAGESGQNESDWRDTALFNGVESPRLPSMSALAVPQLSAGASLSGGVGITGGAGITTVSGGLSASVSAKLTPPSFKFGASASLGTGISGAFSTSSMPSAGLSAGAIGTGGATLRGSASASASATTSASASASGSTTATTSASASASASSVGFD
jgi:hypothetical protein